MVAASPDLSRLLKRLAERATPILEHAPDVPLAKALLSADGGFCPNDGAGLEYDPWSPEWHKCPRCGNRFQGARHHRWWARLQHLWLGERTAHLAALAAFADREDAAAAARELLRQYGAQYLAYPNNDNVLGPSRLFFSTYLESIWITNFLAAAALLRASDRLDEATARSVDVVAEEAAALIGEFNEGASNRQVWNCAALAAIAVWFEDDELARSAVEWPVGLIAHLARGFGQDGTWYEGENYHLFALRGLLVGMAWARAAGLDASRIPELAQRLGTALRAPTLSAMPDLTFPARKDSRFGVSLAQPMYLEIWEAGLGGATADDAGELSQWLKALYAAPAPSAQVFDSYLHEAGETTPAQRAREDLSWWMLLAMHPALPTTSVRRTPASVLLQSQGLAVLRSGTRYLSLECGVLGGGHGHPDRLHLTLHENGVHWLPDPGTGSYVARDLFWYRSTLAHNAPRLDGVSQIPGDAVCEYFDVQGPWSWVRGRFGVVSRTLVSGPDHVVDVIEAVANERRVLELPWHLAGDIEVLSPGTWVPGVLEDEFVSQVERFVAGAAGPVAVRARIQGAAASLTVQLFGVEELFRAVAPGVPGSAPAAFLLARSTGQSPRMIAVLASSDQPPIVHVVGEQIAVTTTSCTWRHHPTTGGWRIDTDGGSVRLAGHRAPATQRAVEVPESEPVRGTAAYTETPPLLDGTTEGFDLSAPLILDTEDQYRRSEEPYAGPEQLSAVAYVAWNEQGLYVAADVTKPELVLRPPDAPPLLLDNEPDDIHSDGVQLYVQLETHGPVYGFLIIPEESGVLRVRPAGGTAGTLRMVRGRWQRTRTGYVVTVGIDVPIPEGQREVRFDTLVNEMRHGRQRRAGQLVWSGGDGWIWLRGDRQDPERFGVVELT